MDSFKDVLEAAQSYCKAQMAEPTYNLYIDGLEPISFEDSSHITLSVRNDFICKIVTDRYLGLLKEAFKTVLGFDVDITLVVPSTPPHEVVLAQQYEANPASPQGNYEFTFENFIKGPSNQFAFAAAQAVAARSEEHTSELQSQVTYMMTKSGWVRLISVWMAVSRWVLPRPEPP